jgi:hypothetical protein
MSLPALLPPVNEAFACDLVCGSDEKVNIPP